MTLVDFQKLFEVKCNANGMVIRVFLSQEEKPIAYFNEKLNDAKQNYSSSDKDLYIVIQALNKWMHYFMPKFFLHTDNHALQFIL